MATTTRKELIDSCLRKLGAPVLDINVDPDQVEDRVDEALQLYQAYHSDAMHHNMLAVQASATDVANKYIELPESMAYVRGVVNAPGLNSSSSSQMSDFWQYSAGEYQKVLGGILNGGGGSGMSSFYVGMTNINMFQHIFTGKNRIRFSRHQDRIYFEDDIIENQFYLVDGYQIVDPGAYSDVWDDYFLKRYATALIKKQWGSNLIKFVGMTLPGGVQFNGELIYNEAKDELERLEEEIRNNWEFPPDFFVG